MRRWRLRLSGRSPALFGGVADAPVGVHAETAFLDQRSERPRLLLPGTALRGVLRDAFGRFAAAKGKPCSRAENCSCPTCHLFGRPDRSGWLWVRSSVAEDAKRYLAPGLAIDRRTRTAARAERALWVEERGLADFDVDVVAQQTLSADELALLDDFWAWLELVGLSIGRRKGAGAGQFAVEVAQAPDDVPLIPAASTQGDDRPERYLLRVTLLEPARLAGHRQRDFYRDGLATIPVSTLRGALGWALERCGAGSAAADLFLERPIGLTPGFPLAPDDRVFIPPWLTRWRCDGDPCHLVDGALYRVAHVVTGAGGWQPEVCPSCESILRELEPEAPPPLVLAHVTIDPTHRRAKRGELHYQVALAPGTVFAAEVLARPAQAEALRGLDTVLVGGRRARGMGLAQIELEERQPLAPLTERIAATVRHLNELGAPGKGGIAVLGLLADAALERPLRATLTDAGLEVLTGDVRSVVRGGWDEQRKQMRPLRRLLAAGSWLAVRLESELALEELQRWEQEGISDPDGVAPLLLRVRDDWEVVDVRREAPYVPANAELDDLVREARKLCREAGNVPERAGLQTLLRFAQSTDSVEETVLFIEYQASREASRDQRRREFLHEVAQFIASHFPGDPETARRFLGLVVRAGYVEQETRKSQRPGGPRGHR
ncbi:MAG: hypothetical protein IT201_01715 [Thermoleophilia bacterium]|nr:hypothetical protein [Thermoleophilia bacterium]